MCFYQEIVVVAIQLINGVVLLSIVKIVSNLKNLSIMWSTHNICIFIVGMFYGIVLHMLHNCIFVDFFQLTEGMKDCQIIIKVCFILF